jgi:hypothetical protein
MYRLSALVLLAGCIAEPVTGEAITEINGASATQADLWHQSRAGTGLINTNGSPSCTTTKIAPGFLLTSAHCPFYAGRAVHYYGVDDWHLWTQNTSNVVKETVPPGVVNDVTCGGKDDSHGNFADVSVVEVDREDTDDVKAVMEWQYPGPDAEGEKVGAGRHDDNVNTTGLLKQVPGITASGDDSGGGFHTTKNETDSGDSGGPFYVNGRVLGVLNGTCNDATVAGYTSIPFHLAWILDTIRYHWAGMDPITRQYYGNSLVPSFHADTEKVCQYACEARKECLAYNFQFTTQANNCRMLSTITGSTVNVDFHGAVRYAGPHSSRTGTVVGWIGGDGGFDAVAHRMIDGRIIEIWNESNGTAHYTSIFDGNTPVTSSSLTAYRRADGISSVVYRSGSRLIEIARVGGDWQTFDLPVYIGIQPVGDPAAYVRADGISAVVYRNSNNHIIELSEVGNELGAVINGWRMRDLTVELSAPPATSDPTAFVRSDGYSSVVYQAGGQIYELYMGQDHRWSWGVPSALANGAPAAASTAKPAGFVHRDGTNAIVYRSAGTPSKVVELWLDSNGWHPRDLTAGGAAPVGDPAPYVRADGLYDAVVYRSSTNHIWELAGGAAYDLTGTYGGLAAMTDPVPWIRHSGGDSVLYGAIQSPLQFAGLAEELLLTFTSGWHANDLSNDVNE